MLILASGSPRRRQLLREAGFRFRVLVSDISENSRLREPRRLVRMLARRKAAAVAKGRPAEDVVVGADTVVYCKGRILVKPRDEKDALRLLKLQNGSWQKVYTGVAVATARKVIDGVAVTRLKARKLPEETLKKMAGKHLDKAGAYAVQDQDDPFIEKVDGAFDNVVGLPVALVRRLLARV